MIWLINPNDGSYMPLTVEQYAALPGHVAAKYLARLSITAAMETAQKIKRMKEARN